MLKRISNNDVINVDKINYIHIQHGNILDDSEPPYYELISLTIFMENRDQFTFMYNDAWKVIHSLNLFDLNLSQHMEDCK